MADFELCSSTDVESGEIKDIKQVQTKSILGNSFIRYFFKNGVFINFPKYDKFDINYADNILKDDKNYLKNTVKKAQPFKRAFMTYIHILNSKNQQFFDSFGFTLIRKLNFNSCRYEKSKLFSHSRIDNLDTLKLEDIIVEKNRTVSFHKNEILKDLKKFKKVFIFPDFSLEDIKRSNSCVLFSYIQESDIDIYIYKETHSLRFDWDTYMNFLTIKLLTQKLGTFENTVYELGNTAICIVSFTAFNQGGITKRISSNYEEGRCISPLVTENEIKFAKTTSLPFNLDLRCLETTKVGDYLVLNDQLYRIEKEGEAFFYEGLNTDDLFFE